MVSCDITITRSYINENDISNAVCICEHKIKVSALLFNGSLVDCPFLRFNCGIVKKKWQQIAIIIEKDIDTRAPSALHAPNSRIDFRSGSIFHQNIPRFFSIFRYCS